LGTNLTDYYYHFTDAESALSILCDGVIRPFSIRPNKSNLKFFGRKKFVYLLDVDPVNPDIEIIISSFDNYFDYIDILNAMLIDDFNSNFYKLEYAFAFRKDKLTSGMKKMSDQSVIWRHKGEIKLNKQDFILLKKNFFTSLVNDTHF